MVGLDSGALAELEKQMPWFDLPLEQLREYRTETVEPSELDGWWQRRLDEARAQVRPPDLTSPQPIAPLISFMKSGYASTALNWGNCFFTFSGARNRKPTCASHSMAVSVKQSAPEMT